MIKKELRATCNGIPTGGVSQCKKYQYKYSRVTGSKGSNTDIHKTQGCQSNASSVR